MDILNELKTFENSNFFIKQPISYVNFYFLYVNNNVLDHIEKECLEIDDKILSDKVINSKLMEYKKNNEKVYYLSRLYSYIYDNLENDNKNFVKYSTIKSIELPEIIEEFSNYTSLFFLLENKKKVRFTKKNIEKVSKKTIKCR